VNEDYPPAAAVTFPEIHPAPEARFSVLAQVWRVLSHPVLLALLLTIAAGAMALHLWLPQLPTALTADPTASSAWLDKTAAQTPGGGVLRALGAFDLAHNAALRLLLPLLAAVLLIHLMNGALRTLAARQLAPPDVWLPGLRAWDATLDAPLDEDAWSRICARLQPSVRVGPWQIVEDDAKQLLCDGHARGQWLSLLAEIGLLLALAALLLNLFSGWQADGLTLIPGGHVALAPYSEFTVGLNADASLLGICCPQKEAPLARGGIRLGFVRVQVTDRDSALHVALKGSDGALKLRAIEQGDYTASDLVVHFPEVNSERAIAAPDANLFFRLVALDNGGFRVQALDAANQMLLSEEIHDATALSVADDLTLYLRPTAFVIVRAWGRPWTWLLLPALLLILIGLTARPYWRAGVRMNGSEAALRWQGASATRKLFAELIAQASPSTDEEAS